MSIFKYNHIVKEELENIISTITDRLIGQKDDSGKIIKWDKQTARDYNCVHESYKRVLKKLENIDIFIDFYNHLKFIHIGRLCYYKPDRSIPWILYNYK